MRLVLGLNGQWEAALDARLAMSLHPSARVLDEILQVRGAASRK
jgi:hypothetical protein